MAVLTPEVAMLHMRTDYDRIQDPAGLIPDDEPVALLRGQDAAAPAAVRQWAFIYQRMGGDPAVATAACLHADRMEAWQRAHGGKVSDVPPGALRGPDHAT
jgi:hypothetical protein